MTETEVGALTPELLALGRLGVIRWTADGFTYREQDEILVRAALREPQAQCQICQRKVAPTVQWNQHTKAIVRSRRA